MTISQRPAARTAASEPTATLLLFVVVLRNSPASSRTYGMAVAIGLLFAAAGDTFEVKVVRGAEERTVAIGGTAATGEA